MAKPSSIGALILCAALLAAAPAAGSSPRIVGGGKANAAGWQFAVALTQRRRFICKVTQAVIDPAYNGRKDAHDFSVLTLASPPEAQPIALATRPESKAATKPGRIVRSAGWGTRSAWGFNVARRLKTTKERVYPARKCDREYGKSRGFIENTMICALGKRIGRTRSRLPFHATSCEGDSGGPLVASTPDGPRLIGAVSSGVFPCGLGGASIYARVASRLGFIQRALESG